MKAKYIAFGILVVAIAITFSAIAVEATMPPGWEHDEWIYDVLRPKIWKIVNTVKDNNAMLKNIQIVLANTFAYVDDLRNRVGIHGDDYDVMPVPTVFAYLGEVLEELKDPNYGLAEIKIEVMDIEDKLDDGTYGLVAIKNKVNSVYNWVTTDANVVQDAELWDAVNYLYVEINENEDLIHDVEAKLDPGGAIYDMLAQLGDITAVSGRTWNTFADALEDIKLEIEIIDAKCGFIISEVQAIEAKLDPGGAFWVFVDDWFWTLEWKIDDFWAYTDHWFNELNWKLDYIMGSTDYIIWNLYPGGDFYEYVNWWFNELNWKLDYIMGSTDYIIWNLYPGGDFYNFVDNWFWNLEIKIDDFRAFTDMWFNQLEWKLDEIWMRCDHIIWNLYPGGDFYEFCNTHFTGIIHDTTAIRAVLGVPSAVPHAWPDVAWALDDIKTEIETIDTEVGAIELKLDAGGAFYNFVNNWFTTIQTAIANHDADIKALLGQGLVAVQIVNAQYESIADGDTSAHDIALWDQVAVAGDDHPVKYSAKIWVNGLEAGDTFTFELIVGYGQTYVLHLVPGGDARVTIDNTFNGKMLAFNQFAVDEDALVRITRTGAAGADTESFEWEMIVEEV